MTLLTKEFSKELLSPANILYTNSESSLLNVLLLLKNRVIILEQSNVVLELTNTIDSMKECCVAANIYMPLHTHFLPPIIIFCFKSLLEKLALEPLFQVPLGHQEDLE